MYSIVSLAQTDPAEVVSQAVAVLKRGGIVIYPTETVYGMGVDATNQEAVDRLLAYKTRREGKPLSIAVSDAHMAEKYVEANAIAQNLYSHFLPGPITVVSKNKGLVAQGVASESGTLGIRIPDYPLVLSIVKAFGKPITASSANASYQKRPYSISDILENISEKQKELIDLIIDAGTLPHREPSTVVDTTLNQHVVLRQGGVKLTPISEIKTHSAEETEQYGFALIQKYQQYLGYKSVIFALQGELGAGKTQLTKGIARGLGIPEHVQSPTFIIEKEYMIQGKDGSYLSEQHLHLYHIDTWRLFDEAELLDLGFRDKVESGNVFVIEWADKVQSVIDQVSNDAVILWVYLQYGESETERIIQTSDYSK